jgi:type I restriction enzyme S subunit
MLSARNIENNRIIFDELRLLSEEAFEIENRRTQVCPGDVLLTIVGTIGRAAVVPENHEPFTLQRSVAVLSPSVTTSKFLMYQLQSPNAQTFFKENARGTAQKGIYLRALGQMEILVPPLGEQNRIVSRLEELLSELDKGVEYLKTAQEQLKVYRQSVLKYAFEGKLTEQWREAHTDQLETATQLLERIQQERENLYYPQYGTKSLKR